MKKKNFVIIAITIGILLLFPIPFHLKDGGSKMYRSIVGIYEVKDWKQMGITDSGLSTVKRGVTVKLLGMKVFDNTKIEVAEYEKETDTGAASLEEVVLDPIGTVNFPTTMSAEEMLQKAMEEDFVVMYEFEYLNGEEKWKEFFETTQNGTPATIHLAMYYTLDEVGVSKEYYEANKDEYPKIFLRCLNFDGEKYTITDRPGNEEQPEMVRTYPYLIKLEGKPRSVNAIFDRYEYYVLVHDDTLTWSEIEWGMLSSRMGDYIDHCSVVSKHIIEE